MKNTFFATLFLLLSNIFYSQTLDLANLATGRLVYSSILYDSKDQVYGYIYFYNQGDVDKENIQLEYVLLDKNLNKVSNNIFTTKKYHNNFKNTVTYCNLTNSDEVFINLEHYDTGKVPYYLSSFITISITNKTISPEYFYSEGIIKEIPQNLSEFKKEFKDKSFSGVSGLSSNFNGYYILEYPINGKIGSNKNLNFFNLKNELLWSYEYNPNGTKKKYNKISINHSSNNTLYVLESSFKSDMAEEYKIIALDPNNGHKKYEYVFENNSSEFSHNIRLKELNGELIITGNYSKYQKNKNFDLNNNLGFYKIVLNSEGKEISKKYTSWEEFKEQIDIDEKGRVEKNFRLLPTKYFIFKDGSICILTEKYKPAKMGIGNFIPLPIINVIAEAATKREEQTTDFVLFFMDKDFNFKKIKTIQKDLSKVFNYDYLFSQYIKDETEAVFFFKDYVKSEKKWILGVTTISNENIKEERIPISSEKNNYEIIPMRAKEGYIILREYNEKDKYNQIRLEKIN